MKQVIIASSVALGVGVLIVKQLLNAKSSAVEQLLRNEEEKLRQLYSVRVGLNNSHRHNLTICDQERLTKLVSNFKFSPWHVRLLNPIPTMADVYDTNCSCEAHFKQFH